MGLDAGLLVMPDGPDAQIGFMNPKGCLGFAQLHVGTPQLFVAPLGDVTAQNVSAFNEIVPLLPLGTAQPGEFDLGWDTGIFAERNQVAPCGPRVLPQQPADLAL